jgi:amino acid permease
MEQDKIIFFRNFLFRAFIIGAAFALFCFIVTYAFWNTWASWVPSFFKVDEKEFGRLMLVFFMTLRIVLVFLFLVPALALHWMAKKKQ